MDQLDPELRVVVTVPLFDDLSDIEGSRQHRAEMAAAAQVAPGGGVPAAANVVQEDVWVDGPAGPGALMLRIYRPPETARDLPCLYWVHGGAHILGSVDQDDPWSRSLVERHDCAVVSVEWRQAPENPFPAALDDAYAGLDWVCREGTACGIDTARVAIGGTSSGAGTAAGLGLRVRDAGEHTIVLQLLIAPMLDDRCDTPSSHRITDRRVWCREFNEIAWRFFLGDAHGRDDVSPYAAPARMLRLAGLAPAFIGVGELDLFLDEDVDYARRLVEAGVSTELHIYRGAHHGFAVQAPESAVAKRLVADVDAALAWAWNPSGSA